MRPCGDAGCRFPIWSGGRNCATDCCLITKHCACKHYSSGCASGSIVQQLAAQIPWMHNILLVERVKDQIARPWYMLQTIENGWSRNIHFAMIQSNTYGRSAPRWPADARALVSQLDYLTRAAMQRYCENHLCLIVPFPPCVQTVFAQLNASIHQSVWGPGEFLITGALQQYGGSSCLKGLHILVLYVCGEHDKTTPTCVFARTVLMFIVCA